LLIPLIRGLILSPKDVFTLMINYIISILINQDFNTNLVIRLALIIAIYIDFT